MPSARPAASATRVGGDDAGEPPRLGRARCAAACAQDAPRAEDVAAVEEPDRDQVEEVEEEAHVGERLQQPGVGRLAVDETGERRDPARERAGDRDERVPPRVERLVLERHVRAEERDEDREAAG